MNDTITDPTNPNYRRPVKLKPDELPEPDPNDMEQLTKKIEHLSARIPETPPPPPPPPDLSGYPISAKRLSSLFPRAPRPASAGEQNRVTLTYTITPETDEQWRDFLQTFTGTRPHRGRGISSAMVELSMLTCMAIVADFHPKAVGYLLSEIANSKETKLRMIESLRMLSEQLSLRA